MSPTVVAYCSRTGCTRRVATRLAGLLDALMLCDETAHRREMLSVFDRQVTC